MSELKAQRAKATCRFESGAGAQVEAIALTLCHQRHSVQWLRVRQDAYRKGAPWTVACRNRTAGASFRAQQLSAAHSAGVTLTRTLNRSPGSEPSRDTYTSPR